MEKYLPLATAVALPHVGGFAGSLIVRNEVKTWYEVSVL